MRKWLFCISIVAAMALFSTFVNAGGLDTNAVRDAGFYNLSNEKKAEILAAIAKESANDAPQQKAAEALNSVPVETVDKWVTVGAKLGKGLASAAKELGVAANEFVQSPLGKFATALLAWHIIGDQVISIFVGISIWIVGFFFIRFMIKQSYPPEIKYSTEQKNIFGNFIITSVEKQEISQEMAGWMTFLGFVLLIAGGLVIKL